VWLSPTNVDEYSNIQEPECHSYHDGEATPRTDCSYDRLVRRPPQMLEVCYCSPEKAGARVELEFDLMSMKGTPMSQSRQRIELRASPDWFARVEAEASRLEINVGSYIRMTVSQHLEQISNRQRHQPTGLTIE